VLQERKVARIESTGAPVVATCNTGCHLQLVNGLKEVASPVRVTQPVSLLAAAYRAEI
jgi:glycolate oxidase iron-sulfur subunit